MVARVEPAVSKTHAVVLGHYCNSRPQALAHSGPFSANPCGSRERVNNSARRARTGSVFSLVDEFVGADPGHHAP